MTFLVAAAAAPLLGPLLYWGLHRRERAIREVDAFVYLAVPILVGLQVLPHAVAARSLMPVVLLVAGVLVPTLLERASRALAERADGAALLVGISGVALHAALEGASLAPAGPDDVAFASAVVLHRVPIGLALWWLVRPRYGVGSAALVMALLVVLTVGGYAAGTELLESWGGPRAEGYQAFVMGSLLHVVFHQGRHDHAHDHPHDHRH